MPGKFIAAAKFGVLPTFAASSYPPGLEEVIPSAACNPRYDARFLSNAE
jgi:hypothetical protein